MDIQIDALEHLQIAKAFFQFSDFEHVLTSIQFQLLFTDALHLGQDLSLIHISSRAFFTWYSSMSSS